MNNNLSPGKLQKGDEIRIIAPSTLPDIKDARPKLAKKRLMEKGFRVTFSNHYKTTKKADSFSSTNLKERADDFNNAFRDKKVKAVIPVTGGYNANQLLPLIDFKLICSNPKIFCGYSDITVLNNAIFAKTGLITFSGPNFVNFAVDKKLFDFCYDNFLAAISSGKELKILPSAKWIDNAYEAIDDFYFNNGFQIFNKGNCTGRLVGGNLCSFNLLHGTEFMPDLTDKIVFVEDDQIFTNTKDFLLEFERNLVSLIQQPNFNKVRGLLIGRFEKRSGITIHTLRQIISSKVELSKIPVIANLDFGHTSPIVTLPIGGLIEIKATSKECSILLKKDE